MIVSFSVSNFRSFASEETLSFVASNRLSGSHDEHAVSIPDSSERVLRAAALYGANGAGKSNLFKALAYLKSLALNPRGKGRGTGRQAFLFEESPAGPSTFDLQFVAADKLYRFGCKVEDDRIAEEWLYQVIGNRQRVLYDRTTDESGRVDVTAGGLKDAGEKLLALATVGGPANQSFLATVNANLAGDNSSELTEVLNWFAASLVLIGPDAWYVGLSQILEADPQFRSFAGEYLRSAATGVDRLEARKREISKEEAGRLLPDPELLDDLIEDKDDTPIRLGAGRELVIEHSDGDHYYLVEVLAAHEHETGKSVRLRLGEESDGTRRLLDLIPALHGPRFPFVYFIDEIDRSLHPMLVKEFLEFFLRTRSCDRCQIVVTTHESNLLDQDLLRRDEIWFAEKDQSGATKLYSLLDFKVRKDRDIRKGYLQGRFGAVPFLAGLDRILPRGDSGNES